MTAIKIKQNLNSIIDNLEDDHILEMINEAVSQIVEDRKVKWDSLSEEEKRSIETGLEQLDRGEMIDYEDLKKEFPKWIGK
jgi:predicted transcriptional regulator